MSGGVRIVGYNLAKFELGSPCHGPRFLEICQIRHLKGGKVPINFFKRHASPEFIEKTYLKKSKIKHSPTERKTVSIVYYKLLLYLIVSWSTAMYIITNSFEIFLF